MVNDHPYRAHARNSTQSHELKANFRRYEFTDWGSRGALDALAPIGRDPNRVRC